MINIDLNIILNNSHTRKNIMLKLNYFGCISFGISALNILSFLFFFLEFSFFGIGEYFLLLSIRVFRPLYRVHPPHSNTSKTKFTIRVVKRFDNMASITKFLVYKIS